MSHAQTHSRKGEDEIFIEELGTRDDQKDAVLVNAGERKLKFIPLNNLKGAKGEKGDKGDPGKDGIQEDIVLEDQITRLMKEGYMLVTNGQGGFKLEKIPEPKEGEPEVIHIDNSVYAPTPDPFNYETLILSGC
jgi:hypothetical protein